MSQRTKLIHTCPKCGKEYTGHSALSREDNSTLICPLCGTREALNALGISKAEQDKIMGSIVELGK